MKIAGLVQGLNHVCCRYRLRAFVDGLAGAGHELDLLPIPNGPLAQFQFYRSLIGYDAVILQRQLIPRIALTLLRTFARKLIFDIDDAVWLRDSYHPRGLQSRKRLHRFQAIVRASDLIVAGNEFLASFAERVAPGRTMVIPTCVDVDAYRPTRKATDALTLVWVGSSSTLQGLDQVRWSLESIGRAVPEAELRIICDKSLSLHCLPVDFLPWRAESESADIASSHIGIAAMPDDDWSRGKCGLKIVQYLAAGLPVIANPVGVHREMVIPGETGFLAETAEQWIAAVRHLASPDERERMGRNAQRMATERYSIEAGLAGWREAIDRLQAVKKAAG